tara:strand:+ start:1123 stop:2373 length:1251 start_codon:yes stop_codon:yes gene_type:complete
MEISAGGLKRGMEVDMSNFEHPNLPNRAIRWGYLTNSNGSFELYNYENGEVDYSYSDLDQLLRNTNRFFDRNDTSKYGLGGILTAAAAGYVGYKIGRARPQKTGFDTEKKIAAKIKRAADKKYKEMEKRKAAKRKEIEIEDVEFEEIKARGGSIDRDIAKFKKQLISKEKSSGLYENFGRKEVRKLDDKYDAYEIGDDGIKNYVKIQEFSEWASGFDGTRYKKGGKVVKKEYVLTRYYVDVHEDSYEEGEIQSVHSWTSSDFEDNNKTFSAKNELMYFIKEVVKRDTDYKPITSDEFEIETDTGGATIWTDVLCKYIDLDRGYDRYEKATDDEIDQWKRGELKLFNVSFSFKVEVYEPRKRAEFDRGGATDADYWKQNKGDFAGWIEIDEREVDDDYIDRHFAKFCSGCGQQECRC